MLTGCSKGGSDAGDNKKQDEQNAQRQQASIKFGDAADSTGPAAAVPGAKNGGSMESSSATATRTWTPRRSTSTTR